MWGGKYDRGKRPKIIKRNAGRGKELGKWKKKLKLMQWGK
jgi:hypothetical protein